MGIAELVHIGTSAQSEGRRQPAILYESVIWIVGIVAAADHLRIINHSPFRLFGAGLALILILVGLSWTRGRFAIPSGFVIGCVAFFLLALPGVVVNKLAQMPSSHATFLGGFLLPIAIYALPATIVNRVKGEAYLNRWYWWSMIGNGMAVASAFPVLGGFYRLGAHERGFFIVIAGVAGALSTKPSHRVLGPAIAVATVITDPRTTMVLLLPLSAAVVFYLQCKSATMRLLSLWVASIAGLSIVLLSFSAVPSLLADLDAAFKDAVGSHNNSLFRMRMIDEAMFLFAESPVIGTAFAGESGYDIGFAQAEQWGVRVPLVAPFHNDYLEVLVHGGLVGIVLFGIIAGMAWRTGMRSLGFFRSQGMHGEARWQFVVLTGFGASLITICFNPVLNQPTSGFFVFLLLAETGMADRLVRLKRQERKR